MKIVNEPSAPVIGMPLPSCSFRMVAPCSKSDTLMPNLLGRVAGSSVIAKLWPLDDSVVLANAMPGTRNEYVSLTGVSLEVTVKPEVLRFSKM